MTKYIWFQKELLSISVNLTYTHAQTYTCINTHSCHYLHIFAAFAANSIYEDSVLYKVYIMSSNLIPIPLIENIYLSYIELTDL